GVGEDAVALAVALATYLFGLVGGIGDKHGNVAIGPRPDFLTALAALGAEFGGLALPLGLHALVNRLAVLFGQVGAADAHVDNSDAERLRLGFELLAHTRHQQRAIVLHDMGEGCLAEHAAQ